MNYFFHPEAEREFFQAVDYYEDIEPGLGKEFAYEVHSSIVRIIQYPDSYSRFSANTRRCVINRFPYSILYSFQKEKCEIIVLAIMNLHRKPGSWDNRI